MQNALGLAVTSKAVALYDYANTGRTKISLVILAGIVMGSMAFMAFATPPNRLAVPMSAGAVLVNTYPALSASFQASTERGDKARVNDDLNNVADQRGASLLEQDTVLERLLAEPYFAATVAIATRYCSSRCRTWRSRSVGGGEGTTHSKEALPS